MSFTTRRNLLAAAAGAGAFAVAASPLEAAASTPSPIGIDWINVKDPAYGAKGDDATDDTAAILAALAAAAAFTAPAAPGAPDTPMEGVVYFPAGKYKVNQTINVPRNVTLMGTLGGRWFGYCGDEGGTHLSSYIMPIAGTFVGASVINITDNGVRIKDMTLESGRAKNSTGGTIDGITATGPVKAVRLQAVGIHNFSGYGVHTESTATVGSTAGGFPGGWEVTNLDMEDNGLGGWYSGNSADTTALGFSDSLIANSEAGSNSANTGDTANGAGWYWSGLGAVDLIGLRSTWNGGDGFVVTGGSGTVSFTECQTDHNVRNGWNLTCTEANPGYGPAPHVISLTSCHASRDGSNHNTGAQGGYAGFAVAGTSSTALHPVVTFTGCTTHVGPGDDASNPQYGPDYGVRATYARRVLTTGCVLTATSAAISQSGSSVVDSGNSMFNLVAFDSPHAVTYDAPTTVSTTVH